MSKATGLSDCSAVLFDLGGTLVDYHRGDLTDAEKELVGIERMRVLLGEWGIRVRLDRLVTGVLLELRNRWKRRPTRATEVPIEPIIARAIAPARVDEGRMRQLILAMHSPWIERVELQPGASAILREIRDRGIRIGLVSNCAVPGYCHDTALAMLGVLDFFDVRRYSYDARIRKPDQRLFRSALDELAVEATHGLMVGDSLELDILPARTLGMRAFHYIGPIGVAGDGQIARLAEIAQACA